MIFNSLIIKIIVKIIKLILIIYLTLIVILFLNQRQLLYFPDPNFPTEELVKLRELEYWVTQDNNYRGLVSRQPQDNVKGTIIVFHGNAGAAIDRSYYSDILGKLGYRVLLAEYPGYGGRKGKLSEESLVVDARKTIQLIHQEYGNPLYVWGESLGTGVVAGAVSDSLVFVDGIVLITPWDTLPNLVQSIYRIFPAKWLVLDKFDSVKNLKLFPGKLGIVLAGKDEVIPTKLGQNLYESLPNTNKKLWGLEQAGHNNWIEHTNDSWWQEVISFLAI